jgi:2-polyprenyl-3-methyl-5-hydroxy-6-metoxy-1,4-benzoquinol methylase
LIVPARHPRFDNILENSSHNNVISESILDSVASPCNFPETADIETSSDDYARRFSGQVGSWFLKVQEEATLRMLAPHQGANILDVGGGHGQLAGALVRSGYRVTVLGSADICRDRIRHLLDENRCSFEVGNILELPYSAGAFDIVLSYRLLPHVTRWPKFLGELSRVSKTAVMIDYPAIQSMNFIAPQLFRFKRRLEGNTRPFTSFKESQIVDVFASRGFTLAGRQAQFFLPMVLHRVLKLPAISSALEGIFRLSGATRFFGSPVILKFVRKAA